MPPAIAFDVLLSEPDRTGPTMVAANLPAGPAFDGVRAQIETLPDPDEQLAEAMSKVPTVLGFGLLGEDPKRPQSRPKPIGGFAAAGDSPIDLVPTFNYLIASLPNLQARSAGNGAVNAVPDPDGVIRRVPLLLGYLGDWRADQSPADALVPTLGLEAIRVALGSSSYNIRSSGAQTERWGSLFATGIGAMKIFGTDIMLQTDRGGELILRDTGHQPGRYISIADLFDPAFPRDSVEGRIILVGTSVEGLKDIQTTPRAPRIPGVEVHAQTIEQIFDTSLYGAIPLQRPFWSDAAETGYLVVFGLLVIGFAYRAGAIPGVAVAVVSVAIAGGGSWYLFHNRGWLVDPLYPAVTAVILVMAATTITFIRTEREKRHIRGAFSMYLSPEMVRQVAEHPERLKLGGENREITVMFTDIRGFTKLSEGLDPQALTHVINAFLTPMSRLIKDHNGTIDKYIGDCIMAFWNAPLDVPHHAREAVRTGVEMRRTLKRLNEQFAAEAATTGKIPVKIKAGVGLNTGIGCVGNMGSEGTARLFGARRHGEHRRKAGIAFTLLLRGPGARRGNRRRLHGFCPAGTRPGEGEGQGDPGPHLHLPRHGKDGGDQFVSAAESRA